MIKLSDSERRDYDRLRKKSLRPSPREQIGRIRMTPRMEQDRDAAVLELVPIERRSDVMGNMPHKGKVTEYRRAIAVCLRRKGYSLPEIAKIMNRPTHSTIYYMVRGGGGTGAANVSKAKKAAGEPKVRAARKSGALVIEMRSANEVEWKQCIPKDGEVLAKQGDALRWIGENGSDGEQYRVIRLLDTIIIQSVKKNVLKRA